MTGGTSMCLSHPITWPRSAAPAIGSVQHLGQQRNPLAGARSFQGPSRQESEVFRGQTMPPRWSWKLNILPRNRHSELDGWIRYLPSISKQLWRLSSMVLRNSCADRLTKTCGLRQTFSQSIINVYQSLFLPSILYVDHRPSWLLAFLKVGWPWCELELIYISQRNGHWTPET